MGLEIHETCTLPDGRRTFTSLGKVRLSGPDGLVARFIEAHQDQDLDQWVFRGAEAAPLVDLSPLSASLLCSSESWDKGERSYAEVISITGRCRGDHTELILMQRPIQTLPLPDGSLQEIPSARNDYTMESLAVKGGTSRSAHSWKLVATELKIGGVIR